MFEGSSRFDLRYGGASRETYAERRDAAAWERRCPD